MYEGKFCFKFPKFAKANNLTKRPCWEINIFFTCSSIGSGLYYFSSRFCSCYLFYLVLSGQQFWPCCTADGYHFAIRRMAKLYPPIKQYYWLTAHAQIAGCITAHAHCCACTDHRMYHCTCADGSCRVSMPGLPDACFAGRFRQIWPVLRTK